MDGEMMAALASGAQLLHVVVDVVERRLRDRPQNAPTSAAPAVANEGAPRADSAGRPAPAVNRGSVDPGARRVAVQPVFLAGLNAFNAEFEAVVRSVMRSVKRGDAVRMDAEDAAQHAFTEMWRKLSHNRWTQIRNPQAYLRQTAWNHYKSSLRPQKPDSLSYEPPPGPGHAELVGQRLDVVTALNRLDRLTSDIVALRLDSITIKDIAEHLGVTQGKVRYCLAKAHQGLHGYPTPPTRRLAPDGVVADAESLLAPGGDLRTMSPDDRQETRTAVIEWQERLRRCPARAFGREGTAMILRRVAALAEALIADRDERAALGLVRVAAPHMRSLGRSHLVARKVRRAWAEAMSELGQYQRAERMLRILSADEERVLGSTDSRTRLLLYWTLVGQGRLWEAEAEFLRLEARLTRSPGHKTLLLHAQCRNAWLLGRLGWVEESVSAYTDVIWRRTGVLSEDHSDTLDARHSQGKVLVTAGRGEQALSLLWGLPELRARVQTDHHSDTLETRKYRSVAEVLVEPRDDCVLAGAVRDLEEILHIQVHRHGPDYPMSRDTDGWLGWLRRVQEANRFGEPPPGI
ncbi:sigma-70 family RNA polymerase sigma factor [Streptomyces sp. WAC 06783]|uniref:sigma-70 family RNA polymerase sigma factor n=1 Tax=Streptomyces sp. WAC 06783 TaxID=2203211 RepID=UPI00163C78D8|nr:sigma-70 family RNA polymerase sigma factor [Streptomyces sp. WAC 06783]